MKEIEARQLWESIITVIGELNDEVARSVRVALFVSLQSSAKISWKRQVSGLVAACRLMLPPPRRELPEVEKGRLLFCFPHNTPSIVQNLLPVAREANRKGTLGAIVAADDISTELSEFAGRVPILKARSLLALLGFRERRHAIPTVFKTVGRISQALAHHNPKFSLQFHRNLGAFVQHITTSVQMGNAFRVLLEAWRPSCVVSTSDFWPLEFQFAHQASCLRIPSVVIQHGVVGHFWWPFTADLYVLWGKLFLEELVNWGAPASRLAVGGMPAADQVFRSAGARREACRANAKPPICLILSNGRRFFEPDFREAFRQFLIHLVSSVPSAQWKVKLHPSEDGSFYRQLGAEVCSRLEIYPPSTSLEDAVRRADVVTTLHSTSGLEAMMLERPLIVPILSARIRELAWWPRQGGGVYAETAAEFRQHLEVLTSDPERRSRHLEVQRAFLKRCFANHGHAAEAIVHLIDEYVASYSRPEYAGVQ